MARVLNVGPRAAVKTGKAEPTPVGSEYPVTFEGGMQRTVLLDEAVHLAAQEFKDWYKSEGVGRFQQRHKDALLGWIRTRGVLRDYDLFRLVAHSLSLDGLATLPVSPKENFQANLAAYYRDHPTP